MKAQHTPGPWSVRQSRAGTDYTHIAAPSNDAVACTKTEANARLIAAAPQLKESLEDLLLWLDDGNRQLSDSCAADVRKARAAIRAAKGE